MVERESDNGLQMGLSTKDRLHILYERRSIRKFKQDQVLNEILMELLEYATLAPSATNKQAWRFVIVTDSALKQKIVDAGGSVLINKAPCGILFTYKNTTRNIRYHDDFQSASACIQNLLLAAQGFGLGACWICNLPPASVLRKLFKMPSHYSPIAYVLLGYPASEVIRDVPRKNLIDEIVSENSFPNKNLDVKTSKIMLYLERFLILLYDCLPIFIKKKFVNRIVDKKFTRKFDN